MKSVSAHDVIVDPERTALLIIDMQNDFVQPTSEIATPNGMALIPKIATFADLCRDRGFPVIYSREMHRPGREDFGIEGIFEPLHCVEGTDGYQVVDGLQPREGDLVVSAKRRYDAFMGTELDLLLRCRGIENLLFTGVCTDICVLSTVMTARNLDYRCYVLSDLVDATSAERQQAALMCMSHVFSYVGDSRQAIEQFGLAARTA